MGQAAENLISARIIGSVDLHEQLATDKIPTIRREIKKFVGIEPDVRNVRVVDALEWERELASDIMPDLFGESGAIYTPDKDVLFRFGQESSVIHEMVHAAGFMPDGISEAWNEAVTQAVAEEIARRVGVSIPFTYRSTVAYFRKYILPTTGLPLNSFAKQYAKSKRKGELIAGLVWAKHKKFFVNRDDWGDPETLRKGMVTDLSQNSTAYSTYLNYLVDEMGVLQKRTTASEKRTRYNRKYNVSARELIEARVNDESIIADYNDNGLGCEIFALLRDRGYSMLRVERVVERKSIPTFLCEFHNDALSKRFKFKATLIAEGRFDMTLDRIHKQDSKRMVGERRHVIELLQVYT